MILLGFDFALIPQSPCFSNGYWALQYRLGVLVETHSWRPYAHRVKSTYETLRILFAELQKHGKDWLFTTKSVDQAQSKAREQMQALVFENTDRSRMIEFRGYA